MYPSHSRSHLFRKKSTSVPAYAYCGNIDDTVEHTLYECLPLGDEKRNITHHLGKLSELEDKHIRDFTGPKVEKMPEDLQRRWTYLGRRRQTYGPHYDREDPPF